MKELVAHARLEEEEEGMQCAATQQPPANGEKVCSGLVHHPWNVRMFERLFPDSSYATPLLMGCIITSLAATPGQVRQSSAPLDEIRHLLNIFFLGVYIAGLFMHSILFHVTHAWRGCGLSTHMKLTGN